MSDTDLEAPINLPEQKDGPLVADLCDAEIPPTENVPLGPEDFAQVFWANATQGALIRALRAENGMLRQQVGALKAARLALRQEGAALRAMVERMPRPAAVREG